MQALRQRKGFPYSKALALFFLGVAMTSACGAGLGAVYEGDVRFEHCMALDQNPNTKPTVRRACWDEWTKFYAFGQTRDRIEFARLRVRQLSGSSNFDEGDLGFERQPKGAVPEPTSVLAPPPMTLSQDKDAGASSSSSGETSPDAPDAPDAQSPSENALPPGAECTETCGSTWKLCQRACATPGCSNACDAQYKRCAKKCF